MKQFALFTPLIFICIGLLFLGVMFLQGYDVGNAMPHNNAGNRFADAPQEEPLVGSIDIADTSELPTKLPPMPTPAKQAVIHAMKHKDPQAQQASRPQSASATGLLNGAASGVNSAGGQVLGAVDKKLDQVPNPNPDQNLPVDQTPVPPVPDLITPPIAQ